MTHTHGTVYYFYTEKEVLDLHSFVELGVIKNSVKRDLKEISEKDLVQEKEVVVSFTDKGYVKRMDIQTYNI